MKIKLSDYRLFRFLNRLVYGKKPSNLSKTEKRKVVVETDLRWEDDGGPAKEIENPIPQVEEDNIPHATDVNKVN